MIARRDILFGSACLIAAGAAYSLKPRKRLVLLSSGTMADGLPASFGDWTGENADGLVQPKTEDELAAKLYNEMVGRLYHQASTGQTVMMLVAYGGTQSDVLQLHRPEVCYPAVGFNLLSSTAAVVPLPGGADLPVRRVVAAAQGRQENIVYWARIGEYLPDSGSEQRKVRFENALEGYVPDGVLARFSVVGSDAEAAFATLDRFIPELLSAVAVDKRRALIGTRFAKSMNV